MKQNKAGKDSAKAGFIKVVRELYPVAHGSRMPPAKCPYLHRYNKYTDLICQLDKKDDIIAAKDREIAQLKAENALLKASQRGGERNPAKIRLFGSSMPSSKIPVKTNTAEANRKKVGG